MNNQQNAQVAMPVKQHLNPVLARLMEEVRNNKNTVYGAYDRTHNRHNRGQ